MDWLFERGLYEAEGLRMRVQLLPTVAVEEASQGALDVTHAQGSIRLDGLSPQTTATVHHLTCGWVDQLTLWSMAGTALESLSEHAWVLNRLDSLLRIQLTTCSGPLLTVEPVSRTSHLALGARPENAPRLSRFAFLQGHADGLVLESAVAGHRVVLHDERALALIGVLGRGNAASAQFARPPSLDEETALAALDLLHAAGMLDGCEGVSPTGISQELLETGEFHDLLFHRRSRFGHHDHSFGARFPYLGERAPRPAVPPPLGDSEIRLPLPSEHAVYASDPTLTEALESRASIRHYADRPMTLAQLAEFLFRCARVRSRYGPAPELGMPYEATDRPFPSGGGMHDLELYLIADRVEDLPRGAYHYAADRHALEPLRTSDEDIAQLLRAAMRSSSAPAPPHVSIHIASRFDRMCWKYRAICYATTLKNVGVLYQTMYLVGTAMKLAVCALGSGDDVAAERALNLASRSEIGVGEMMIGVPRADAVGRRGGESHSTWRPGIAAHWGLKRSDATR